MDATVIQSMQTVTTIRWDELQAQLHGPVITPGMPNYDEARLAWNLAVTQYPAAVVVATSATDIARSVQFAARHNLPITVQSTGHGVVRPANNSLLIITSTMKNIQVDAEAQTAWIEAGAKWGEVLEKTQAVGLAPLLGSSPDVGVMGYTLGGGMGWLGRKYGLATDSVRYFEVVTAEGQLLRVSETENSDLFWGLRGGSGNLAIVTGMEISLYPVTTVYGGNLFYPMEMAQEVMARYRDWTASAPDELTSSVVLMNFPPIPLVPEPLRGKSFVMVRGCYCGPIEQGEALVQPWREWRTPAIDMFGPMPFSQVASISNDPVDPMPGLSTSVWLQQLSDEAIDILVRHMQPGDMPGPVAFAEVRHFGGAVSRVSPQANAYGNRDASLLLQMIGVTPTPEAFEHLVQYTNQLKAELQPYLTGGVYMNFLEGDESQQRVKDGFLPETFQRLKAIKAAYDPHNRLQSGFKL